MPMSTPEHHVCPMFTQARFSIDCPMLTLRISPLNFLPPKFFPVAPLRSHRNKRKHRFSPRERRSATFKFKYPKCKPPLPEIALRDEGNCGVGTSPLPRHLGKFLAYAPSFFCANREKSRAPTASIANLPPRSSFSLVRYNSQKKHFDG